MRSHAKAPTAFTFGRKGFVAHALVALALAALFALSLASSANAADRHIDSYVGPKPVNSPNIPGGTFSFALTEIALYTGNDANPSNDKVFTVEAGGGHRVQRLDAADNSFERMWGKDTIAGNPGTGYEICVAPATCKSGTEGTSAKGEFDDPVAIAVDQEDPALGGEGSVYVYDRDNHRIQKFDLDGNFIAMFGDNVNQTTTGDVCTQESGDTCKTGVGGTAAAQIGPSGSSELFPTLAVDPETHDVYVADPTNRRIQQWSGTGSFERAFGLNVVPQGGAGNIATNEKQTIGVGASSGTFTLTFGANTTAALPFNASAAEVQTALNGLASINTGGGSVSVAGGPGDLNATSPYVVSFDGGPRADAEAAQITVNATNLQAGVGRVLSCTAGPTSAAQLKYQWLRNGAPIAGAEASTYTTIAADEGKAIQCQVFALNANAGATQVSNPATVIAPLPSPLPPSTSQSTISQPVQSASLTIGGPGGQELTCSAGSWNGSPTSYTYQWYRNGAPIGAPTTTAATSSKYTVQASDLTSPAVFQCVVTATNAGGSVSLASSNRTTSPSPNPAAPTATAAVPLLATTATTVQGAGAFEICTANCQAGSSASIGSPEGQFATGQPLQVAVDSNGILYASDSNLNNRVQRFDTTEAAAPDMLGTSIRSTVDGGPLLNASTVGLEAASDHVYVLRRTTNGVETRIQEINPAGTGVLSTSPPAAEVGQLSRDGIDGFRGLGFNPVDGRLYVPVSGSQAFQSCPFPDPVVEKFCSGFFVLDEDGVNAPTVTIGAASEVTDTSATLAATINPAGTASYRFEYSKDGVSWTKAAADVTVGGGSQPISQSITGLTPNTLYRVRIVTTKIHGVETAAVKTSTSAEATFVTDALPPTVTTYSTSRYGTTTATLGGLLNPNGSPTTYRFEWGKSTSYGNKVPIPNASAGSGTANKGVLAEISGLQPGTLYHYRLCAESPQGEACGTDKTFTTRVDFGPPAPQRAYEMMTPPLKALPQFGSQVEVFNNPNPGIPSLDGEAMMWANGHFPLSDDVGAPMSGDLRLMRRTPSGWTFETRSTLPLRERCPGCAPGESLAPVFARIAGAASSGDMETVAYGIGSGVNPELLPSEGPLANRYFTRRDGTGVEGWTPWLTNPSQQMMFKPSSGDFGYVVNSGDPARINDDGTAMVRWHYYRGLAEDPATPLDDDPSDDQQIFDPAVTTGYNGLPGGRTIYLQRADDPDQMPSAPKDLVNECTGTGAGDATQLPARIGSGAATDTIEAQPCWASPGLPEATGTGTVTGGSNTIASLNTQSGNFAVGQLIEGPGIPPSTRITAVGAGTLTLSAANTSPAQVTGSGQVANGSNTITSVTTSKGAFAPGQKVRVTPGFFFSPPFDVTVTAVGAGTLTLSAPVSGLFISPDSATLAVSEIPGAALEADSVHMTSVRGAVVGGGGGGGTVLGSGGAFSQTAMSEHGDRVFFMSPDNQQQVSLPASGCASATGPASTCVPQLFVRQYNSEGKPTVRWISRAQGVGAQQVAELGRGAFFEGASRSGDSVYFKTNSPLLPNDPNGGNSITTGAASDKSFDLYRYELPEDLGEDPANGTLTRVSGGPSGNADPSTNNSTADKSTMDVGSGGALRYLSDDGELAYFVTTSPLAGADQEPPQGGANTPGGAVGNGTMTSGTRNLYLYDDTDSSPQWRFIASLPFAAKLNEITGVQEGTPALNQCASHDLPTGPLGSFSTRITGARFGMAMVPLEGNCFRGTPDGRHVIFQTAGRLTGDDTDDASDIYLYDYERDELIRVTAPPPGAEPYRCNNSPAAAGPFVGGVCNGDIGVDLGGAASELSSADLKAAGQLANARGWGGGRYYNLASNPDGTVSVFFNSRSNLVAEDTDTLGRSDVYEWREGKLTLMTPEFPEMPYWYSGSSLDGEDLFVNTQARIDPREIDEVDHDIYDLRVGGGFPFIPPPTPCDVLAHECRSTAAPNPEPRSAASAGFASEGNLTQKAKAKPRRCGKGKVRSKGRCVKAKAKKSKKAVRRATNQSGRAGR